jgi:hypothetical protein
MSILISMFHFLSVSLTPTPPAFPATVEPLPLLGIGPEGGEALSSHHIWTFMPSICTSVHPYIRLYPPSRFFPKDRRVGGMNVHM